LADVGDYFSTSSDTTGFQPVVLQLNNYTEATSVLRHHQALAGWYFNFLAKVIVFCARSCEVVAVAMKLKYHAAKARWCLEDLSGA